jgi:hypothetical protein
LAALLRAPLLAGLFLPALLLAVVVLVAHGELLSVACQKQHLGEPPVPIVGPFQATLGIAG